MTIISSQHHINWDIVEDKMTQIAGAGAHKLRNHNRGGQPQ